MKHVWTDSFDGDAGLGDIGGADHLRVENGERHEKQTGTGKVERSRWKIWGVIDAELYGKVGNRKARRMIKLAQDAQDCY